jgi:cobalt transporter subunit CbtA
VASFQRLLLVAVLAGLCTGLLTTLAHQQLTVPLILQAEVYEAPLAGSHHGHQHEPAWQPADGWERKLFTAFSDVMTAIGFALLLGAVWLWRGAPQALPQALLWGLAGYASFVLAPSLGLPAELPGAQAGPLAARQIWWLASAIVTAGGLGLLVYARRWWWRISAVALLLSPHLIGAPATLAENSALPVGLHAEFIRAVFMVGLLFWLLLAARTAHFFKRMGHSAQ